MGAIVRRVLVAATLLGSAFACATPAVAPAAPWGHAMPARTARAKPAFPPGTYGIATVRSDWFLDLWSGPSISSRYLGTLWPRGQLDAPTSLSVLAVRGDWVEGLSASRQSGGPSWLENRPVWVPREEVILTSTPYRIDVSISAHRLTLTRVGRAVKTWVVGVGAPSSPTPTGRFVLIEKLPGPPFGPAYGCCMLGLSVMQDRGSLAGGQIAIHGTNSPSTIGANVSNGCVHGTAGMLRELLRLVPLGAPVYIRR